MSVKNIPISKTIKNIDIDKTCINSTEEKVKQIVTNFLIYKNKTFKLFLFSKPKITAESCKKELQDKIISKFEDKKIKQIVKSLCDNLSKYEKEKPGIIYSVIEWIILSIFSLAGKDYQTIHQKNYFLIAEDERALSKRLKAIKQKNNH